MAVLLSAEGLLARGADPALRLIDARFELTEPAAGRRWYREGHLPGAVFLDLDEDLAAPPGRHGGRHPLPDLERLASTLGRLGVGDDHDVVVYDQGGTFYAARAWWLLRYLGHRQVRVLDGGVAAYLEAGGALVTDEPAYVPTRFTVRPQRHMVADVGHVEARLDDPDTAIVDARAAERYRGEVEPLDPKAGHVPGAVNRPYAETFDGPRLRSPQALRERFAPVARHAEVIHYCGSGVSAAHNVLAMEAAGLPGGLLYAGSWSDWCSYDRLPVATGDEGP